MNVIEKYIGESQLKEKPGKKLQFLIGDKAVKTKHLDDASVTSDKIGSQEVKTGNIEDGAVTPEKLDEELLNEIRSVGEGGYALSNRFGNSTLLGMTQRSITQAINKIWQRISEITGERVPHFKLKVTPDYFISTDTCPVSISAECELGNFDSIYFYADDILLAEASEVNRFEQEAVITGTTTIKAVAVIMGIEYEESFKVRKYFPFFIGAGSSYEDVVNDTCIREYNGQLAGEYEVKVEQTGHKMYIVIPASLGDEFDRAEMSNFVIPMQKTENPQFIIYESLNQYRQGIYNINIIA